MIANIAPKISCPLLNILAIFIACKGNLKWIKKLLFLEQPRELAEH